MDFLKELIENNLYKSFKIKIAEESEMTELYFLSIKSDVESIFNKMSNPNPDVIKEIQTSEPTQNMFEELYKDSLINYYLQLSEEREIQCNE